MFGKIRLCVFVLTGAVIASAQLWDLSISEDRKTVTVTQDLGEDPLELLPLAVKEDAAFGFVCPFGCKTKEAITFSLPADLTPGEYRFTFSQLTPPMKTGAVAQFSPVVTVSSDGLVALKNPASKLETRQITLETLLGTLKEKYENKDRCERSWSGGCWPSYCGPAYHSYNNWVSANYHCGAITVAWTKQSNYTWKEVNIILAEVDYLGHVIPGTVDILGKAEANSGYFTQQRSVVPWKSYGVYVGVDGDPVAIERLRIGETTSRGTLTGLYISQNTSLYSSSRPPHQPPCRVEGRLPSAYCF